ncbi:outer membrane lipoprotein carrier protein LolA [Gluconobacter oxydans]|uniref:Outer membrane lipoprotein carrier protein LolA n=2 Tax=Gluconobacter oxydans TaxID=442 RepID=A0AB35AQL9_GLUOY|nr:outer membrane lipoprotein carrier protein LolA [Gluconobacter oxydans]
MVQLLRFLERAHMTSLTRLMATLFCCFGLLLPRLSQAAPSPDSAPVSPERADAILTRVGAVPARDNTFHEVRNLVTLTRPLESSGTLKWRAPDYLEKLTLSPRREDLVIRGSTVTMMRGTAQPQTLDATRNPALQLLADTLRAPLSGDTALLHRYYHIAVSGTEGGLWTLTLSPATNDVRHFLKQVAIAGTNNAITRLEVIQANGDHQTMTILP